MLKQRGLQSNLQMLLALGVMLPVIILVATLHSTTAKADNAANTLKITPVRTDIQIEPGTSKTVPITATNLTNQTITVTPYENDFVAGDEKGTPALILDANQYAPSHSLKRFMTPLQNVTLAGGKSKTINVVITVPQGAQPGGYFGAIRLAPASPDGGGQVNLNSSVASLILMTVPGNVVESLTLTNFDVEQNGHSDSFFNTPNNLQVAARFQNNGGLQQGPIGNVAVKEGDKVVYSVAFNDQNPRDMVLPGSARRWTIPLDKIGTFGHYTVVATFTYGKTNQTIDVTRSFWIVPVWLIISAIAGLILLIAIIVLVTWLLLRRRRRYASRKPRRR